MSQCRPDLFLPPVSGYAVPSARWHVPPIFSSKSVFFVYCAIPSFRPKANSPTRRAPSSIAIICSRKSCPRAAVAAEPAFVIRTLLIHEYRKIHLQDPLLPPALLPADWVGAAGYELCKGLYARVFAAAEGFLSNTASTISDPLPAANAAAYARFGGIASAGVGRSASA